jgi:5-formyltetrahydrofolate cyclo-ligase
VIVMQGAVIQESRDTLRNAALFQRRSLAEADCLSWSRSIQERAIAMPQFHSAQSIALYSSIQNEVGTETILSFALASGKTVYFPKLSGCGPAGFAQITRSSELIAGRLGIREPINGHIVSLIDCDGLIVFAPGVLFDRRGYRLGRGGGWYDRVLGGLKGHGVFVGLAYDCQIVEQLPTESWDQRVHFIISQSNLIDCNFQRL